ncbi:retrovirus-related pol polyprotein from transposon TNT 1-94, partial [Tanacetum coccineum]
NLEVAFHQHTYFIRNLEGVDLLTGSRGNNLYTLPRRDMMSSSPICLLSKASKTNVNRKKYILVIVDDYSRFTWVKCLRSKDEALNFIIKFLKMIQVGISHETSVACSLQQNGFVERRNRTLIEAACIMLIYAKAPLFLWAESVAIACYTQNRSIIRLRHGKNPYELLHDKLPDLSFLYVFCALCYPTNDSENWHFEFTTDVPDESFDELLTPSPSVDHPAPEVIAAIDEVVSLVPAVSTGSPSSTIVDQDAPSPSSVVATSTTEAEYVAAAN